MPMIIQVISMPSIGCARGKLEGWILCRKATMLVHNTVSRDNENSVLVLTPAGGSKTGSEKNAFGDFAGNPLV